MAAEHKLTVQGFQILIASTLACRYSCQMGQSNAARRKPSPLLGWLKTHTEYFLISMLVLAATTQYLLRPQVLSFDQIKERGVLKVLISDEPDSQYVFNRQHYGFEYELLYGFAQEHELDLDLQIVPYGELFALLKNSVGDMAVGGIIDSPFVKRVSQPTIPWFKARTTVVYQRGTPRPNSVEDLAQAGVRASSRYFMIDELSELNIKDDYRSEYELLSSVAAGTERFALTTNYRALGAKHYLPKLNRSFLLPDSLNLVWALPVRTDKTLLDALNQYLAKALEEGKPRELADRYFARQKRLSRFDALAVHRKIATELPQLEYAFKHAARRGDIDWQLLAALAYQESRWSNDAVSPTGVRGIMQLTQETATYMGVDDRLDMEQSISGAARYLKYLKDRLPDSLEEPELTWFALGCYNVGIKHVLQAYRNVRNAGKDPTRWQNIADVLPTLYGTRFPQGQQAVDYVERIQIFTDILRFHDLHLRDDKYFESLAMEDPIDGSIEGDDNDDDVDIDALVDDQPSGTDPELEPTPELDIEEN